MLWWLASTKWTPDQDSTSTCMPDDILAFHTRLQAITEGLPSLNAARAAIDRAAKAFLYAASVLHGEDTVDEAMWVEKVEDWPAGFTLVGDDLPDVATVWDTSDKGVLLGPSSKGVISLTVAPTKRRRRGPNSVYQEARAAYEKHANVPLPQDVAHITSSLDVTFEQLNNYIDTFRKKEQAPKRPRTTPA